MPSLRQSKRAAAAVFALSLLRQSGGLLGEGRYASSEGRACGMKMNHPPT